MEQRIVATRQILAENGNLLTLQYFLLKERTPFQKEKFGVMIQERSGGEKALAPNLSTSAAQVFQLIRRLADCTVTPTALADVLAGNPVRRPGGMSRMHACECMYGYDLPRT